MKSKYFQYNDFPPSIAKGGKEVQMHFVAQSAKELFGDVFELSRDGEKIEDKDIVHFFGDTPHFLHIMNLLSGIGKNPTYVISPNFYKRDPIYYKFLKIIPSVIPNWYSERKKLYEKANKIVVNSDMEKDYLCNIFGKSLNSKIEIIFNTDSLLCEIRSLKLEDIKLPKKYICMISHLNVRKNIFSLIKASDKIFSKTQCYLVLAGGARFNSESEHSKFIQEINSRDHIIWVKERSKAECKFILENCSAHVLPSFVESPGISNLDAVTMGIPTVCGDFSIVRNYLKEYENVFFCGFDSKSISAKVIDAINAKKIKHTRPFKFNANEIKLSYQKLFKEIAKDNN